MIKLINMPFELYISHNGTYFKWGNTDTSIKTTSFYDPRMVHNYLTERGWKVPTQEGTRQLTIEDLQSIMKQPIKFCSLKDLE